MPTVRTFEGWTKEGPELSLPTVLQSNILTSSSPSDSTTSLSTTFDSGESLRSFCSNSQDSFLSQENHPQKGTDDKKELLFKIIDTNNKDLVAEALTCKASRAYKEEALTYSAEKGLARSFRELVKSMFNGRKRRLKIDILDLHTLGKAFLTAIPERPVTTVTENEQRFQIMKDFSTFVLDVINDHEQFATRFPRQGAQQINFYGEFKELVADYIESGVIRAAANNQLYLLSLFLTQLFMYNTLQVNNDYFTSIALRNCLSNNRLKSATELLRNRKYSFSQGALELAFCTTMAHIEKPGIAPLLEILITNDMILLDQRGFALVKIIETTLNLETVNIGNKDNAVEVVIKNNVHLATLLLKSGCLSDHYEKARKLLQKSSCSKMKTALSPYLDKMIFNKEAGRKHPPPQGYFSNFENYFSWLRSYLSL